MSIETNNDHSERLRQRTAPLQSWLWRSYVRTAIIPLLVIEVSFLVTYWISSTIVYEDNAEAISDISHRYVDDIARREANAINILLESVASDTRVFAQQALVALDSDVDPPQSERERYTFPKSGGLYTNRDNGTTASFYSGATKIGEEELEKVWSLSFLDPLMISLKNHNQYISSIYFNSYDSYNRIYPYIDVSSHYDPLMDIPSYNFYYEADAEHNPERRNVWTEAYIDPAGHGWMVSSIAPVWRGNRLEGVVGIDITLANIIARLLKLDLPWNGYAILIDQKGSILALPPAGERDFGISELTAHDYNSAILADTLKPDDFNVNLREDARVLAAALKAKDDGQVELDLNGDRLASFVTIPQTGWRLVIVAPTADIYGDARSLRDRLELFGYIMLASLLLFYGLFFAILLRRARETSELVSAPLRGVEQMIEEIGMGHYRQEFAGSQVQELDRVGQHLVLTGRRIETAENDVRRHSRTVEVALAKLREANDEMTRFARVMSHHVRTPLSVIDSGAQIIERKAGSLSAEDLKKRANRLRIAVSVITQLLSKLIDRLDTLTGDLLTNVEEDAVDVRSQVTAICRKHVPDERLELHLPEITGPVAPPNTALTLALGEVLENAMQYSEADKPIRVTLTTESTHMCITVANQGCYLTDAELQLIDSRFSPGTGEADDAGIGMGFYLARNGIEEQNGTLTIASIDGLTTITIRLPIPSVQS